MYMIEQSVGGLGMMAFSVVGRRGEVSWRNKVPAETT
jgi:hypothetical protein